MKKNVDNRPAPDQDNPEEGEFVVHQSLMEVEELLEQRLENKPRGENSLKLWRKDVNRMVEEINFICGWNKHKKV